MALGSKEAMIVSSSRRLQAPVLYHTPQPVHAARQPATAVASLSPAVMLSTGARAPGQPPQQPLPPQTAAAGRRVARGAHMRSRQQQQPVVEAKPKSEAQLKKEAARKRALVQLDSEIRRRRQGVKK